MKKFLCAALALLLCANLCACSVNIETPVPATDGDSRLTPPASESDAVSVPLPDTLSDTPAAVAGVYVSDLGFTLAVPGNWIAVTEDENGITQVQQLYGAEERTDSVRFYDLRNAEAGYGGTLVTVMLYAPGEEYDYLPDYELLGENEKGSYVALFPTDVQASPASEELLNHHLYLTAGLAEALADGFRLS